MIKAKALGQLWLKGVGSGRRLAHAWSQRRRWLPV